MDKPAPHLILSLQLVQQTVHDVIADEGAGSLRHRGRDPAIAQRADDRFDRQGAEPRGRPAVDDRRVDGLLAFVIGDTRIIDVNRHTFDADIDPAAGLSHRDNQLRLQVFNRRVQRRQRLAKHAGKLPGNHRLTSNHCTVKLLHHFPGRVHRLAVKGFKTGE